MGASLISELSRFQLLVIGTIAILVTAFGILVILGVLDEKKTVRKVAATPCPHCGTIFGSHSVELAKQDLDESIRFDQKHRPKTEYVTYAVWYQAIRCPSCDKRFWYDPPTGSWNSWNQLYTALQNAKDEGS